MGCMKNYLLTVITQCSDQQFGQDAVEWAVNTGRITLSYNLQTDLETIMGKPGELPETYDRICADFRTMRRTGPQLPEELLRPLLFAQTLPKLLDV